MPTFSPVSAAPRFQSSTALNDPQRPDPSLLRNRALHSAILDEMRRVCEAQGYEVPVKDLNACATSVGMTLATDGSPEAFQKLGPVVQLMSPAAWALANQNNWTSARFRVPRLWV